MNATLATAAPSIPQRKADLQTCLRNCTREGLVAMPIVTMSLPVNVFMIALITKVFPLSKPTIGVVCALPFVGNFIQIFVAPFLARWRPPKFLTVTSAAAQMACWAVLGVVLPWIPRDDPSTAGVWIITWFLTTSCFGAVAGVSWNAWIQEWVPARLRGKYFGRRNGWLQLSTTTFLLVVGWVLARWEYAVPAFQVIIFCAVVLRVFSLRWQWLSPTRAYRPASSTLPPLADQLQVLRRARSLLNFAAFGAIWSFATYCFGPFYHVFMFEQMQMTAFEVGLTATVAQLGGALSLPAWGRLLDRYGNKPVMAVSLILWQLQYLLWVFIMPGQKTLLYAMWAWAGATGAGFVLGQFTILLRLIPVEAKSLAIGFNLAVTSLVAAVAPVIGGWILSAGLARWSDPLAVYHACFLLQPVLALSGCLLLLRVHEPLASPLTMVFGAMRNIRTLGAVLGLEFLVNYVFYRPQKR